MSLLQELQSSVSDIVEDILKMHDTTKVRQLHVMHSSLVYGPVQNL